MLPAAHRLRRSKDFAHTVRRGRRAGRGSVVVHLTSGSTAVEAPAVEPAAAGASPVTAGFAVTGAPVRAGFVVSKAVGPAVVRNKVKRRLRHLMAERLSGLPVGSAIVVRAQPGAGLAAYPELAFDLDRAIEEALRPRGRR